MKLLNRTVILRSLALGLVALALVFASAVVRAAIAPLSSSPDTYTAAPLVQPKQMQPQLPDPYAGKPAPLPDTIPASSYTPPQEIAPAHPTNYGQRVTVDINGNPVQNALLVVIHETVGSASSAINTFRAPHYNENDQVSYHSLIKRDGTVVFIVSPEMRAFGAGNSVFVGANGPEAVRTHPQFPASVNNFAYHVSLETPSDGRGNSRSHSGYTEAQYRSLAWVIAQTGVPDSRITTHRAIDRSGNRLDPRSFDPQRFMTVLYTFPRANPA
ncbi:N-acetylmuramoyl-L-alanine amidase [Oculatella sp. LEGE 06141]|uniref:peptidoglycan recognition protein family protein n=1 Tax=Oculatella sp. LEGE 06141 TaxID=1828648 RepID=UPI00188216BE|nr:peptidoglycan recognition family protein [Oculatella sp. LEGE 06141]MBE9177342.1 N-acetylmuramoyl-L-alanine amidase [Oculatella sp. LEGE 06141]